MLVIGSYLKLVCLYVGHCQSVVGPQLAPHDTLQQFTTQLERTYNQIYGHLFACFYYFKRYVAKQQILFELEEINVFRN